MKKCKKQKPSKDEIQWMLESINPQKFWEEVTKKACVHADEYRRARAKSRAQAIHHVFL